MAASSHTVPGVYRRPALKAAAVPRVRTDVAGFVGVAGPARLHEAVAVDDWRSFEQLYLRDAAGQALAPPAGATLAAAVRAYFLNGGERCWVVNVRDRVERSDARLLPDLLGIERPAAEPLSGRRGERTVQLWQSGLELLLAVDEVAIVAIPDLDAAVTPEAAPPEELPLFDEGRFACCPRPLPAAVERPTAPSQATRLFSDAQLLEAQRHVLERCGRERWRVFALLSPPPGLTAAAVQAWRWALAPAGDDPAAACAALYWPWLLTQEADDVPPVLRAPLGQVAGVFAQKDRTEGPFVAPANATLAGVVATETPVPVSDRQQAALNLSGVNVIRAFRGAGLKLWGARTLYASASAVDTPAPFAFINIRRGLSAIERTVRRIGEPLVFEPNLPFLRLQLAQMIASYLLAVFATGAFAGDTPEESFVVRCDGALNPPAQVDAGQLICEVGVALAAPSELIFFRVDRRDGAVDVQEVR